MALNSVAEVRAAGGLDHTDDYRLFRLNSDADLSTAISNLQPVAVAWLSARASTYYTGSSPGPSSTTVDALFKYGEALLTLHFLFLRLKARKVFGTHWAVDSEASDRYEELIDQELLKQVEGLLEGYLTIEIGTGAGTAIAFPAMALTDEMDPADYSVVTDLIQEDLDVANGVIGEEVLT